MSEYLALTCHRIQLPYVANVYLEAVVDVFSTWKKPLTLNVKNGSMSCGFQASQSYRYIAIIQSMYRQERVMEDPHRCACSKLCDPGPKGLLNHIDEHSCQLYRIQHDLTLLGNV